MDLVGVSELSDALVEGHPSRTHRVELADRFMDDTQSPVRHVVIGGLTESVADEPLSSQWA